MIEIDAMKALHLNLNVVVAVQEESIAINMQTHSILLLQHVKSDSRRTIAISAEDPIHWLTNKANSVMSLVSKSDGRRRKSFSHCYSREKLSNRAKRK